MKITNIKIEIKNLSLTKPYTIAYKTIDSVENVIVTIIAENQLYGIGASNTSKDVVKEDTQDAFHTLSTADLSFLIGRNIACFYDILKEIHTKFSASVGARAALDIAMYDLFTKYIQVPLVDFLGIHHTSLPTSVTIGIMSLEETIREADNFIKQGFAILKLKLGSNDIFYDIERTQALRRHIKSNVLLRVDANQGWSLADYSVFCNACITHKLDVEFIEQPFLAKKIFENSFDAKYDAFRNVAFDEDIITAEDAYKISSRFGTCIYNIKLMKSGGISPALQIAQIGKTANAPLMWGCNDESIISIAAALHTAFSCPHTKYIDLDGSFDLEKDVVSGGFHLKKGVMSLTNRNGLGVNEL